VNLTHIRTENGTPTLITTRAALDEIETVMAADDDDTEMYGSGSTYNITYPDGRQVNIRPATPDEIAGPDVSARELAAEIGATFDDVLDAAADLASEWLDRGHRAVFRTTVGNDATISTAAANELRNRVKPQTTVHGRPAHIVTVNGKRYVVDSDVSPAKTYTLSNGTERTWPGGVDYWTERNGKCFGPVRVALGNSRPGTVGAAIWAAANR
jgi:hypothetical protein